jgi:ATP-dependent DNA ligase
MPAARSGWSFPVRSPFYPDREEVAARPPQERKASLAALLSNTGSPCTTATRPGARPAFFCKACGMVLEGIVSKRADAPYAPALNREEFVVIPKTRGRGSAR